MKADPRFLNQPLTFWAYVRTIGEIVGYTDRKTKVIKVPSLTEIEGALTKESVSSVNLRNADGSASDLANLLLSYFALRADMLNRVVRPLLMDADEAQTLFQEVRKNLRSKTPVPMNKQKGKKRKPAFLTGIVNMIVDANRGDILCDLDPRQLTSITHEGLPLRTLARRVDGAFPSAINPVAIWEIKEYYHTTTFGSRVADGVYETLLDGMELKELHENEGIKVEHLLVLDARFTWWECGRSYLCRIIDMLHMGHVDEILVGREVVARLPELVKEWVALVNKRED